MDKQGILRGLGVTAELLGTPLSTDALEVMANDLIELAETENDVLVALMRVRREHKGRLTLAAILERLPNRPMDADAAWDIAMRSKLWDEDATIVLPQAIFCAFPFAVWNTGDKVAARMAFKANYPECARKSGDAVEISLGSAAGEREPAIIEALRANMITADQAKAELPHLAEKIMDIAAPDEQARLTAPASRPGAGTGEEWRLRDHQA